MIALMLLIGVCLAFVFFWQFMRRLTRYREERDYIDLELNRCSQDMEEYWKNKKRKLLLWLLFNYNG